MKTIVIATSGTCGDLFPYLALGRELKNRGYAVRMSVSEPLLHYVHAEGLEGFACRPVMGADEAARYAEDWDHWESHPLQRRSVSKCMVALDLEGRFQDLLRICQGADYFLCSPVQFIGQCIHDATAIPWLSVAVMPFRLAKQEKTQLSTQWTVISEAFALEFNTFRHRHGLSALPTESFRRPAMSSEVLLAASRHFFDPPQEIGREKITTTGFIPYTAPSWRQWQPEAELRAFMEADLPPLVLTFSSLPLVDPERVVRIHTDAARRLGRRLLILSGWAGFRAAYPDGGTPGRDVFMSEFLPHEWVFRRAGAVIHHGGIGTMACCLQQGCPMLVEPYGNDQFFNAHQILLYGLGAAMHPHRLTVAEVTRVLAERVLADGVRDRSERFAVQLGAEQGLTSSADFVEQWMDGR